MPSLATFSLESSENMWSWGEPHHWKFSWPDIYRIWVKKKGYVDPQTSLIESIRSNFLLVFSTSTSIGQLSIFHAIFMWHYDRKTWRAIQIFHSYRSHFQAVIIAAVTPLLLKIPPSLHPKKSNQFSEDLSQLFWLISNLSFRYFLLKYLGRKGPKNGFELILIT